MPDRKFGGSKTASNETPVASTDQPDPPDGTTRPPRRFDPFPTPTIKGDPLSGKPTGRDHADLSEHDHRHQRLHGESDRRLKQQDRSKD
jgi:hypothetical protein